MGRSLKATDPPMAKMLRPLGGTPASQLSGDHSNETVSITARLLIILSEFLENKETKIMPGEDEENTNGQR